MVADTPTQPIPIKTFCCRLVNDPTALTAEAASFADLPQVRDVSHEALLAHFELIRAEVARVVQTELDRIRNAPEFAHLVL
jgi:hypothetical protein